MTRSEEQQYKNLDEAENNRPNPWIATDDGQ